MAKEQFFHVKTRPLFKQLEQLSVRSGMSRGQAFEDWLTAMTCALAAGTMEDEYMAMVQRHKEGKAGKRGIDLMPQMFANLVDAMETSDADILGDLFQGAITYGEAGQYLTPESLTTLLSELTVNPDAWPTDGSPILIGDPCCGTGRMLESAAKINPHAELVGQDIDARCAKMTAINLGLRSRYGWVVCGNSLTGESQFAYRIGSFFHETPDGRCRGVIREVPLEQTPVPVLRERLREQAGELFDDRDEPKHPAELSAATIIEVPQWLNRLEPQLAAMEADRRVTAISNEPPSVDSSTNEEPPPTQGMLF